MPLCQSSGKNPLHFRYVIDPDSRPPARRWLLFFLSAVLICLSLVDRRACADGRVVAADFFGLPPQYGEIIYQNAGSGANHLYIIGISHRDPQNGSPADTTLNSQAEVFRIGEWLSTTQDMQLLLPEGYFHETEESVPSRLFPQGASAFSRGTASLLDNDLLYRKLGDTQRFVNAEMLLMNNYHLPVSQIEDKQLYYAVRSSLSSLDLRGGEPELRAADRLAELDYLQQTRTATLLQKIPSVIDLQIQSGIIRNRSAMFTIGLNHLQDIIRYLQNDAISIDSPARSGQQGQHYQAELNLLKNDYKVTIILPRTLANNRRLLQLTRLDHIFPIAERQSEIPWLN